MLRPPACRLLGSRIRLAVRRVLAWWFHALHWKSPLTPALSPRGEGVPRRSRQGPSPLGEKDRMSGSFAGIGGETSLQKPKLMRQPKRDCRNERDQQKEGEHGKQPGQNRDGQLAYSHFSDARRDIEVQPHRRMTQSYFHVHRHQDAEMDRMHPKNCRDRE